MNWENIKIETFKAYRSSHRAIKKDRMKVTIDMPIEDYTAFRRQIEAPHSLRDRRAGDKTDPRD